MNLFRWSRLLIVHLFILNRTSGKLYDASSTDLSVVCQFFARISQLQWHTQSPLPSQVRMLHCTSATDSPLMAKISGTNCPVAELLTIRNESRPIRRELRSLTKLKGQLLVMECANDYRIGFTSCDHLLATIAEHNLADQLVARRLFVLLIVYDNLSNTISSKLSKALLQSHNSMSKVHAAIVTYRLDSDKSRFYFDRVRFVRPLKNVCSIDTKRNFIESKQINVKILARWLLARDSSGIVIPCDFEGNRITAVITKSFFCQFETNEDGDTKLLPSVELNAFLLLAKKFNFTYDTVDANGSYGRKVGSAWFGSIGYLVNETADMALCDLIYTNDRFAVVDFTFPYDMQPVSFLTKKPGYRVRKWAFFFALPPNIWVISFATLIVCGGVIKAALWIRMSSNEQKSCHEYSPFMMLFSIFLQQSMSHQEFNSMHNFEIRVILIMWSFITLILMRCYSGIFYSSITVPDPVPPIDSVDEVHQAAIHDTAYVFTSRYIYDMAMAAKCCHTFEYDLGQHVRRHPHLIAQQNTNFEARIDNLQRYPWNQMKPLIFITSRSILLIYTRYITYALHVSSATFLLDALGIAYQKDALYGPFFSDIIVRMLEAGLMDKWLRNTLMEHEHLAFLRRAKKHSANVGIQQGGPDEETKKSMAQLEAENIHNFRVDELQSVFMLYLCGNAVAILVFLVQLGWRHIHTTHESALNNSKTHHHCSLIESLHSTYPSIKRQQANIY